MTATMPKHRGNPKIYPIRFMLWKRALALALLLMLPGFTLAAAQESTPEASPTAEPTPSPSMPRLELELEEFNDSGIGGTVTLYDAGDRTIVEFDVDGAGGDHPAHIHAGVCGDLDPEPAFNLENVDENGESTTVVDVTLEELLADDYAIDMHLAPNELGTLIACADIDGEPELPADATPEASPESTPSDGTGGTTSGETTPTEESDGTGGAIPTATLQPAETETPVTETTPAPTPTEIVTTPEPTSTEVVSTAEATSEPSGTTGQGDVSDGTGGATSAVSVPTSPTTGSTTSPGDGTSGVSGKGEPVPTQTLPQQAGVGAGLDWPDNPREAMIWASTAAALILGASSWVIRRGETSTTLTPSRWSRLGL